MNIIINHILYLIEKQKNIDIPNIKKDYKLNSPIGLLSYLLFKDEHINIPSTDNIDIKNIWDMPDNYLLITGFKKLKGISSLYMDKKTLKYLEFLISLLLSKIFPDISSIPTYIQSYFIKWIKQGKDLDLIVKDTVGISFTDILFKILSTFQSNEGLINYIIRIIKKWDSTIKHIEKNNKSLKPAEDLGPLQNIGVKVNLNIDVLDKLIDNTTAVYEEEIQGVSPKPFSRPKTLSMPTQESSIELDDLLLEDSDSDTGNFRKEEQILSPSLIPKGNPILKRQKKRPRQAHQTLPPVKQTLPPVKQTLPPVKHKQVKQVKDIMEPNCDPDILAVKDSQEKFLRDQIVELHSRVTIERDMYDEKRKRLENDLREAQLQVEKSDKAMGELHESYKVEREFKHEQISALELQLKEVQARAEHAENELRLLKTNELKQEKGIDQLISRLKGLNQKYEDLDSGKHHRDQHVSCLHSIDQYIEEDSLLRSSEDTAITLAEQAKQDYINQQENIRNIRSKRKSNKLPKKCFKGYDIYNKDKEMIDYPYWKYYI